MFLMWIAALGIVLGVIVAIVIACLVTRIWSPSAWREEAQIQKVLRGDFGSDDKTTNSAGAGSITVPKLLIIIAVAVIVVFLVSRVFAYCDANRWVDPLAQRQVAIYHLDCRCFVV